jgi:hypothetical protein
MNKLKIITILLLHSFAAAYSQFTSICNLSGGTVTAILADTVAQRVYFAGGFPTLDNKDAGGLGYYDPATNTCDTIRHSDFWGQPYLQFGIARYDSVLYFGGSGFGYYDSSGNQTTNCYMKFDGSNWIQEATPYCDQQSIRSLYINNNQFYMGGFPAPFAGMPTNIVVQRDLISGGWNSLPYIDTTSSVLQCMIEYQGKLVVAGNFAGQANQDILQLINNQWQPLGNGPGGSAGISSMINYNGLLIVGGNMVSASGNPESYTGVWDGSQWSSMNWPAIAANGTIMCVAVLNGEIYAGGSFYMPDSSKNFAKWDGTQWVSVGSFFNTNGLTIVTELEAMGNSLYIGGVFNSINGIQMNCLAKYTPTVALPDDVQSSTLYCSPNPASGYTEIICPYFWNDQDVAIQIFSVSGALTRTLKTRVENGIVGLNISELHPGSYTAIMTSDNRFAVSRVTVCR